jgi:hypothetical protein
MGDVDHNVYLAALAQQILGHCWEIMRQEGRVPKGEDPILEFYWHIRNGCFHGNRFHFKNDEPKNRAEWRGIAITRNEQSKPIFRESMERKDYFLNWGDSLLLLHDACALAYPQSQ